MIGGFYRLPQVTPQHLNKLLETVFRRAMAVSPTVRTTPPSADDLDEGEACLYNDGTNQRIYMKIGGSIYQWVAGNPIPSGTIVIWSGSISSIPDGWVLCDGNNGTPDLTGRFVVHADADSGGTYNVGDTGGENAHTLTTAELPAHDHGSAGAHTHIIRTTDTSAGGSYKIVRQSDGFALQQKERNTYDPLDVMTSGGAHTHSSVGSNTAHENRPPYYALAYIMKT